MISKEGIWTIKAGEVFNFKGFDCMIVGTRKEDDKYFDTIKIDNKFHELSREDWIKKFTD